MYGYGRFCDRLRSSAIIWKQLSLRSSAIVCDHMETSLNCTEALQDFMAPQPWYLFASHAKHANNPVKPLYTFALSTKSLKNMTGVCALRILKFQNTTSKFPRFLDINSIDLAIFMTFPSIIHSFDSVVQNDLQSNS